MAISDLDYADDSDVALIRRARSGDRDAFALLHGRHVGSARALAWRMSRSASDADDLVSEGFARVLGALQRGRGPEVAFRPYLLSTVRRLAYDRTDRERREAPVEHELDDPTGPMADPVLEGFEKDTAAAAFSSLPERWRLVLWHTEVEGQKPAEVAKILGIKPNAVAALAYRAREGLRQAYLSNHVVAATAADAECRYVGDRLAASIRGGLTPANERRVDEHLDACDDCRAAYLELANVNTALRGLVAVAVLGPMAGGYLAELASPTFVPLSAGAGREAGALAATGPPAAGVAVIVARAAGPRAWAAAGAVAAVVVLAAVAGWFAARDADRTVYLADRSGTITAPSTEGGAAPLPTPADSSVTLPGVALPGPSEPTGTGFPTPEPLPGDGSGPIGAPGPAAPIEPRPPTPSSPPGPGPEDSPKAPPIFSRPMPPSDDPPEPPARVPEARLGVRVTSAGRLVRDRPGMVLVTVSNEGQRSATDVSFDLDLGSVTLRRAPDPAGWTCTSTSPDALRCSVSELAAGDAASVYVPVTVPGLDEAPVSGVVQGIHDDAAAGTKRHRAVLPVAATGLAAQFAAIEHGGVLTAGNGLMTCPEDAPGCVDARSGIGVGEALNNNTYAMVPVDTDGDPATANSSSAEMALPPGARVLSAVLVHGADATAGPGGVGPTDPGSLGSAVVRAPDGTVTVVAPDRVDAAGSSYQGVADVTDLVRAHGGGTWTVGGIQLGTGQNRYAGWSLVVAYRDDSAPLRSLVILDGLTAVEPGTSTTLELGGFVVPDAGSPGATVAVVSYEGDLGTTGDQLVVGGTAVADAANATGNTFNGTVSDRGVPVPGRSPSWANLFGFDTDRFDIGTVLPGGSTSTIVELTTSGDRYLPGAVAITVDQ